MFTLIQIELYKVFKKWRTYIGFIAVGLLVMLIQVAMIFEGQHTISHITRSLQDTFLFTGNLLNGYFISYLILNAIAVHIPFLITLVAGDLLAGEATAGTYRIILTRPITRFKFITAKFLAGAIYSSLLILFLAIVSLVAGMMIFGTGELIVMSNEGITLFAKNDILWRFLLAYCYAALGMTVVCSLAFLFSSLVENAIGPIISTMTVIIVFLIISNINIEFFQVVKPYLFTTYILDWREFFKNTLDIPVIMKAVSILFIHIIILFTLTAYLFKRKDILS